MNEAAGDATAARVLVLARDADDGAEIAAALRGADVAHETCSGLDDLRVRIGGAGAVIVAEEAIAGAAAERFRSALAAETSGSDVPVILLGAVDATTQRRSSRGPRFASAHVVVLGRPVDAGTLASAVRLVLRARRLEYEARGARERAERAEARLAFLDEITRSITSSLNLDTVLERIAEAARDLCRGNAASIFLREGDAMAPRYRVGAWRNASTLIRLDPGRGLGGESLLTGRPQRSDDCLTDPRVPPEFRRLCERAGVNAVIVVPIVPKGHVEGLLYIGAAEPRAFSDDDERVSVRLADVAAIAIENATLFRQEQEARSAAEAASRIKDEFLAILAHELRNPLAAITTAVGVIDRTTRLRDSAGRAGEIIKRQARNLARLVDDLLDVARVASGKIVLARRPVDLADVAEHSVAAIRATGRLDRHRVEMRTAPAWVQGDATRLEQIVGNLVTNAVKYTPAGGAISICVESDDEAILRVEDTGIGIPADLLPRLFDPFVQGDRYRDRAQGGLGLGLAVVRRLVELHGGRIEARSAGAGCGAQFVVRLPRIAGALAASAPRPANGRRPAPLRVLLIEDNADAREALRLMLELEGHEVHAADDGESGLAAAAARSFDVALIDLGLPDIDGYEVARRLGRLPSDGPARLIALSGYAQPTDRQQSADAGFQCHLVKPVDPDTLVRVLAGA